MELIWLKQKSKRMENLLFAICYSKRSGQIGGAILRISSSAWNMHAIHHLSDIDKMFIPKWFELFIRPTNAYSMLLLFFFHNSNNFYTVVIDWMLPSSNNLWFWLSFSPTFAHHFFHLCSFTIDVCRHENIGTVRYIWCVNVSICKHATPFIVCEECGKIEQTKATPNSIHTSSIKWIGTMLFENALSRHFHARGNCHANRTDRIPSPGKSPGSNNSSASYLHKQTNNWKVFWNWTKKENTRFLASTKMRTKITHVFLAFNSMPLGE